MSTPLSAHQGGRIVAEYTDREHYIPLRIVDLIQLLRTELEDCPVARDQYELLARRLGSIFHYEYHLEQEKLKEAYAPFDPDQDIHLLREWDAEERKQRLEELFAAFDSLLQRANYTRITREKLEEAFSHTSAFGIPMQVDFNQFERLEVYSRGDVFGKRARSVWWRFWKEEELEVDILQRVVIIVKMKKTKETEKLEADTSDVFMKIFKDIPKADIEMLLPGARVRFNNVDRSKIGFPILTGVALIVWNVFKASILGLLGFAAGGAPGGTMVLWGMTAGALGYGYRSYYSYNFTKNRYRLQLTQSLYYQNLDNNAGVIFRLIDSAEEQEIREALLAYFFLWQAAGQTGWTELELDDHVEEFLETHANIKVDFEIHDALAKLKRLGLVAEVEGEKYCAVAIELALERLEQRWEGYSK